MTASPPTQSPLMTLDEIAAYTKRTPNALRILRHRHRGPRMWLNGGRLVSTKALVDEWFQSEAAADERFNRAGLPPVEPRIKPAA